MFAEKLQFKRRLLFPLKSFKHKKNINEKKERKKGQENRNFLF